MSIAAASMLSAGQSYRYVKLARERTGARRKEQGQVSWTKQERQKGPRTRRVLEYALLYMWKGENSGVMAKSGLSDRGLVLVFEKKKKDCTRKLTTLAIDFPCFDRLLCVQLSLTGTEA